MKLTAVAFFNKPFIHSHFASKYRIKFLTL